MAHKHPYRTLVALAVGLLLLAAIGCRTSDSTPPNSGIEGLVTIGPNCPVVREDEPCPDKPYEAELVITTSAGREVARTNSVADGRYQVALKPGDYILIPQSEPNSQLPFAGPMSVTVQLDTFTTVDISYDTGIR